MPSDAQLAVVVALTLILVRLRCFGCPEPAGDGTR